MPCCWSGRTSPRPTRPPASWGKRRPGTGGRGSSRLKRWRGRRGGAARAPRAVILVGQGVLRTPGSTGILTNLLDLLLLTGQHGRPGCGLGPLAEENNDQGAVEMGAAAEYLPGPFDQNDQTARARLAGFWKEELPKGPGKTLMEILE